MRKTLRDLWINQTALQELYSDCTDPVLKKYEINSIEFKILLFLQKYPELNRAADIVKYTGLSKSYVSLSVKILSERGFLTGEKRSDDRKNIYLTLLPAADPIVLDGFKAQQKYCNMLLAGFDKEEADQFLSYFDRITKNVRSSHEELEKKRKKAKKSCS